MTNKREPIVLDVSAAMQTLTDNPDLCEQMNEMIGGAALTQAHREVEEYRVEWQEQEEAKNAWHKRCLMLEKQRDELAALLETVKQACLFDDDDGRIGVSEDVVIPTELFTVICEALNKLDGDER